MDLTLPQLAYCNSLSNDMSPLPFSQPIHSPYCYPNIIFKHMKSLGLVYKTLCDLASPSSTISHLQLTLQKYKLLFCHSLNKFCYFILPCYFILLGMSINCLLKTTQLSSKIGSTLTHSSAATLTQLISPLLHHVTTVIAATVLTVFPIYYSYETELESSFSEMFSMLYCQHILHCLAPCLGLAELSITIWRLQLDNQMKI